MYSGVLMASSKRLIAMLLVAFALCALPFSTDGRNIEVDWTPDGVRPYRDYRTPLRTNLGDTLILRCGQNVSNLFIQTDQVQYDTCNSAAGSGMFDYNGFCLPGGTLMLTLTKNSQNLMNTVNFVDNSVYYLTSHSNGLLRDANNESINWGGQCDFGVRMIFVIGDVPPNSLPTPTPPPPTPVVSRVPVVDRTEDNKSHNMLIIIATTTAGSAVVIIIAVTVIILLIKVGYFNRLKNQSDPLSRQVAINIDSNTQDKGFYRLVKGNDSESATPSPSHDNKNIQVVDQNLRPYGIQPVQRNYYVDSPHLPVSRMSSQQSEEDDQQEAQNDYVNSPSGPTSDRDHYKDYVNSPSLPNSPNCDTEAQVLAHQYSHHVTSPTVPVSKPLASPRAGGRILQAKRKFCVDSPSLHSIASLASQHSTSSEVTVKRSFYVDSRNLPPLKPPLPQRGERVMQLKRNFCIDSSPMASPPTSTLTSPEEKQPTSHPFHLDFSSSPFISSFVCQRGEGVQLLKRNHNFCVDSPSIPTSRSSSPLSDNRWPYKKTGQQIEFPSPSPVTRTGLDSERSSPSPTVLPSQLSRTFKTIDEHEVDSAPVTFKPGMQAWRII